MTGQTFSAFLSATIGCASDYYHKGDGTCGSGTFSAQSVCAAGYNNSGSACISSFCGDNVVDAGEQCDDGNASNSDGCSDVCAIETGYTCSGQPNTCQDINECITNTDNCDADATCTNTAGSFTCACNAGFSGDGTSCASTAKVLSGFEGAVNGALNADADGTISGNVVSGGSSTSYRYFSLDCQLQRERGCIEVGGTTQTSGSTANDFANQVNYVVTAEDGSTASYTVAVGSVEWVQQAYLKAPNADAGDQFGHLSLFRVTPLSLVRLMKTPIKPP